ncbi:MAG: isoprenylcysteine carboxylmethyltransferase family protein [Nocardioides sp.]|uniref:methyltransferase family protein n=1 Tax=Nocardioides sp. TaxID=35761 RepID=UPI0039E33F83
MAAPYSASSDLARVMVEASAGLFLAGEVIQALHRRRDARGDLWPEITFRIGFFASILLLPIGWWLAPAARIGGGVGVFALGMVIGWVGLLLRWWSFVSLGRYFTTVVKVSSDQPVIDRGPYRILRHPSYTGLLLIVLGCGLVVGNWVGLVGSFVLMLGVLIDRLVREERALTIALGDDYRDFAAGRAWLVPWVW